MNHLFLRGSEAMRAWKLEIEYEGTRYAGWQRQPHARTVQGELLGAAKEFFGDEVEIGGAGRTDAGVHALQQVADMRLKSASKRANAKDIHFGLNKLLPHDINILSVRPAPSRFHARHDAVARYYLYQISTRRTAFGKSLVWWVRDTLDVEAMSAACRELVGRHDFRSFCESAEGQGSTVVHVQAAQLATHGRLILFRIGASHFLWKMVRRVVGVLVEVGRGNLTALDLRTLLKTHSRATASLTAPPSGLFLERVLYEGERAPDELKPAFHLMSS